MQTLCKRHIINRAYEQCLERTHLFFFLVLRSSSNNLHLIVRAHISSKSCIFKYEFCDSARTMDK